MKTLDYRTVDKTGWGPGAWMTEPDKMQWPDEDTGLPCLIVRNHGGALCGYVGVPREHPAYGKHYNEISVEVHGGLTFSGPCQERAESTGICHIPGEGETDAVWWHGFDCSHLGDLSPAIEAQLNQTMPDRRMRYGSLMLHDVYRDFPYVAREVRQLAAQLYAMPRISSWRGRWSRAKYTVWEIWLKPIRRRWQFWRMKRFVARMRHKD